MSGDDLFFPDGIDEAGFFQLLNETRVDYRVWVEGFGARVARLQGFEHELDALHIDVGNTVLIAGDDFVGRVEHVAGRDFARSRR